MLRTTFARDFPEIVVNNHDCERSEFRIIEIRSTPRRGRSENSKIVLEATEPHLQLRVFAPETQKGSFVIECVPFKTGKSLHTLRKQGAADAKRFAIEFFDQTNQ